MNTEHFDNTNPPHKRGRTKLWLTVGIILTASVVAILLYSEMGNETTPQDTSQLKNHNIPAMVRQLENRLKDNPANGEGWLMLGRSYSVMGRTDDAVNALANAQLILGDTTKVLLEYSQALASARKQPSFTGRPAAMINQALQQDPDNPQALWLSGLAAAESGDYTTTSTRWENLLAQQAPDSEDARIIRESLQDIRKRMNSGGDRVSNQGSPVAKPALKIGVSVAPELASQVQPLDPVFIYARATDGTPMPLAVVKKQVRDLPVTITLDDSQSMMPGRNLSTQDKVDIVVRISKSGGVTTQSGDMQAKIKTVAVGTDETISLTIDSLVP